MPSAVKVPSPNHWTAREFPILAIFIVIPFDFTQLIFPKLSFKEDLLEKALLLGVRSPRLLSQLSLTMWPPAGPCAPELNTGGAGHVARRPPRPPGFSHAVIPPPGVATLPLPSFSLHTKASAGRGLSARPPALSPSPLLPSGSPSCLDAPAPLGNPLPSLELTLLSLLDFFPIFEGEILPVF